MNNFTMNSYEMKRDLMKFSEKITKNVSKPEKKFISDMIFGISKSGTVLISEIARSLKEEIKLNNTIERLCDNLASFDNKEIIMKNYYQEVSKVIGDEPVVLFDDSDITKIYGKKFEDIDRLVDGSSITKEVKPGYHVCEATLLGMKEKQPISIYSEIYSSKSDGFISKNKYTLDSIDKANEIIKEKYTGVFDRGYDDNKVINYMEKSNKYFVIRMNDRRTFIFKNKKKNCYEEAIKRKGKIRMTLLFDDNVEYEVYVSHTKVIMPSNKKEYELVIVYGLSEERPLILLTNREIHNKEDVIKVVRLYFSRWRIEEYFRAKKQEYDFENIRVRSLKSINNVNTILTIYMGYIGLLIEKIDKKLLVIKIIERSKSLRKKVVVWISQIARGIKEILSYCHTGIKEWQQIEIRTKYKQLELKL